MPGFSFMLRELDVNHDRLDASLAGMTKCEAAFVDRTCHGHFQAGQNGLASSCCGI